MAQQSIFGLANIDSPFKDWKTSSSSLSSLSNEDEDFTLGRLLAEAKKYKVYRLLKQKLSKKWTISLRYDGAVSSTAYRTYSVRYKKITPTDVRQIKIDSEISLSKAVGDLVFEITNALNSHFFEGLDFAAIKGRISKERYIKKIIRIEMESHYNVMKLCNEMLGKNYDLDDLLLKFQLSQDLWSEFKRTLLPNTDANYIEKNSWLDHLTNIQFDDKTTKDHAKYGKIFNQLRNGGERGGFKKSK